MIKSIDLLPRKGVLTTVLYFLLCNVAFADLSGHQFFKPGYESSPSDHNNCKNNPKNSTVLFAEKIEEVLDKAALITPKTEYLWGFDGMCRHFQWNNDKEPQVILDRVNPIFCEEHFPTDFRIGNDHHCHEVVIARPSIVVSTFPASDRCTSVASKEAMEFQNLLARYTDTPEETSKLLKEINGMTETKREGLSRAYLMYLKDKLKDKSYRFNEVYYYNLLKVMDHMFPKRAIFAHFHDIPAITMNFDGIEKLVERFRKKDPNNFVWKNTKVVKIGDLKNAFSDFSEVQLHQGVNFLVQHDFPSRHIAPLLVKKDGNTVTYIMTDSLGKTSYVDKSGKSIERDYPDKVMNMVKDAPIPGGGVKEYVIFRQQRQADYGSCSFFSLNDIAENYRLGQPSLFDYIKYTKQNSKQFISRYKPEINHNAYAIEVFPQRFMTVTQSFGWINDHIKKDPESAPDLKSIVDNNSLLMKVGDKVKDVNLYARRGFLQLSTKVLLDLLSKEPP